MNDLVSIDNLSISFGGEKEAVTVVDDVSIQIKQGERVGIVGESGSGKTLTSLSLLGLLPSDKSRHTSGSVHIYLDDEQINLKSLRAKELNAIRGKKVSMIFQEPLTSLDPVYKCGHQVDEVFLTHISKDSKRAKLRTLELFAKVMIQDPERIYNSYPHEISGGQIQRVMIAMSLVCNPVLLIADEPTTALDVTIQKEIISLIRSLSEKMNMSVLFVSHDLALISNICDRVYVMYKGKVVEEGITAEVFSNPKEEYTRALLECRPSLSKRGHLLATVENVMTTGLAKQEKEIKRITGENTVLEIKNLTKIYYKEELFGFIRKKSTHALKDVSLGLHQQEILGIIGESGSGKSTLIKCILGIEKADHGEILFDGRDLSKLSLREWKPLRKKIQIIFQDPYSSLNPKMKLGPAISEALDVIGYSGNRSERVNELFLLVGLGRNFYNRYPYQLSGGERQRICIARALAMEPEILLCDESVSALDVSIQAQVLNLLLELRTSQKLSIIFITHDFSVVSYLCDRIMVMEQGRIVEENTPSRILKDPKKEYTKNLIKSIPSFNNS